MTPDAGNPDSFPATIDLPDDSDPPAALTFNVANEGLTDRTASLANGYRQFQADLAALKAINTTSLPNGAIRTVTGYGSFKLNTGSSETEQLPAIVAPTTGPGRWEAQDDQAKRQWSVLLQTNGQSGTIPSVITRVAYDGYGNGAGGGGGGEANTGTASASSGGGGGAGAQRRRGEADVVGGASYALATAGPGAGGAGGNGGSGADGTDGDDLTVAIGVVQLIFPGAQGGRGGGLGTGAAPFVVPGGSNAPAGSPKMKSFVAAVGAHAQVVCGPGAGGWSADNFESGNQATFGAHSLDGFGGGGVGAQGATVTNPGGMGGGGGGGGPNGAGGHGGNGGSGRAATAGDDGTVGLAPVTAFSGAGGGGGGGGGNGSTSAAKGGNGGAGERGQVTIRGVH